QVDAVPERGGDVLANRSDVTPGGSFNVLVAATRQGLRSAYAGATGTGPFGDLVRAGLRDESIEVLLPASRDLDTGYDVAITEADGERRFLTAFGAEASLTEDQLAAVELQAGDLVHVSGYGLLARTNARVIPAWLLGVRPEHPVLVDPGPLVDDIGDGMLQVVLERADWLSCNEREASVMTGKRSARHAAQVLAVRYEVGVVVRTGPHGCVLVSEGVTTAVPGFRVDVVDTNGAGDAHVGAFLAGLAADLAPVEAARRANAAAALAASRPGPATAPTSIETDAFLAARS
ncbi:MAG: PfkB family carbohydrate kinase, partial [Propionibacteriaceae bacterium]